MTPTRAVSSVRERALAFAPVVLMLVVVAWSIELFHREDQGRALVRHTETVLSTASSALSNLRDAETSQRGYLLTDTEEYLHPYRVERDSVGMELNRLRVLTEDNPRQQRLLDALAPVVALRLIRLDSGIAMHRAGHTKAELDFIRSGHGKRVMDSARAIFADLRGEERRLLDERVRREELDHRTLRLALVFGVVFSALISYLISTRFARKAALHSSLARELSLRNDTLQQQALEIRLSNQQLQAQQLELELSADQMREHADELAQTTTALRQANAAKGMFLANMSHELRTPLNAIAGHVQLIEMELHGPVTEAQKAALARIARAQRHLLALINDILNFAKLDAGRLAYAIVPTDVGAVMSDVTGMVETQMTAAGLTFSSALSSEPCEVWADAEKLGQILINLFSNATKFTKPGGHVSFEVARDPNNDAVLELRVTDTGIGIPSDKLEQVFDPFVQLNAMATSHQGTGLGLSISRDLARGMGGELTVSSKEGVGSTFTVTLRRVLGAADAQTSVLRRPAAALRA
jgi:signal transduction histidine kinase